MTFTNVDDVLTYFEGCGAVLPKERTPQMDELYHALDSWKHNHDDSILDTERERVIREMRYALDNVR